MRKQTVKISKTVEVPEGYMLVPDHLRDWRISFNTPDDSVGFRAMVEGPLPKRIGPFKLVWAEAGGAMYEEELKT